MRSEDENRAWLDAEIERRVARLFEIASEDTPERRREFDELLDDLLDLSMRDAPDKQKAQQA